MWLREEGSRSINYGNNTFQGVDHALRGYNARFAQSGHASRNYSARPLCKKKLESLMRGWGVI